MRFRVPVSLVTVAVVAISFGGCLGTVSPPVDNVKDLKELVLVGQTLSQVQGFMTDRLATRAIIYPANNIVLEESGWWKFAPKKGGRAGDTDAPFLVMLIRPDRAGDNHLAVFFEGKAVVGSEWYAETGAGALSNALSGQLDTGTSAQ